MTYFHGIVSEVRPTWHTPDLLLPFLCFQNYKSLPLSSSPYK